MTARRLPRSYRITRSIFHFLFRILTRLEVVGLDNLPHSGAYIFVNNHLHLLDAPVLFSVLEDRDATGFVGSTHQRNWFIRWLLDMLQIIWLHRGEADKAALTAALDALKQGRCLGVAPEGTRSKTGGLQEGKEGVAFLVSRAKVPVYPVALINTHNILREWKRLRRPTVRIVIGQPFDLTAIAVADRTQRLAAWTDEMMCQIAALLPPEYRGVYADHPRLKELLSLRPAAATT